MWREGILSAVPAKCDFDQRIRLDWHKICSRSCEERIQVCTTAGADPQKDRCTKVWVRVASEYTYSKGAEDSRSFAILELGIDKSVWRVTTGKNGKRVGITPNANFLGLSGRFWLGDESKSRRPLLHKMLDQAQISRRTVSRNTTWSERIPNAPQTFPFRKFPDPVCIAAVAQEQTASKNYIRRHSTPIWRD